MHEGQQQWECEQEFGEWLHHKFMMTLADIFDVLQAYAIDHGDVEMAYGTENSGEDTQGLAGWLSKAKDWNWQRLRGYPSIPERKEALLARLS